MIRLLCHPLSRRFASEGARHGAFNLLSAYAPVLVVILAAVCLTAVPVPAQSGFAWGVVRGSGFAFPFGIAVDASGNIFVADTQNSAVKEILHTGVSQVVETLGGGFNYPYGVAVDSSDNVFVADTSNNVVKEIPAGCFDSNCVITMGSGFNSPTGIALDSSGDLFVTDFYSVKEIPNSPYGYFPVKTLFKWSLSSGAKFLTPQGIAVDKSGNLFFAVTGAGVAPPAPAVYETTAASGYTTVSQVGGNGGFQAPEGVAVDSSGNVYVTDISSGHNGVWEITAASGYATVNSLATDLVAPACVAIDSSGEVFIGDQEGYVTEYNVQSMDFGAPAVNTSTQFTLTYNNYYPLQGLTQGAAKLDFTVSSPLYTCPSPPGPQYWCFAYATFSPAHPGPRYGAVEAYNGSFSVDIHGEGGGPQVIFSSNSAPSTLGGGFSYPNSARVDGNGNVFVADTYNGAVKEIVAPEYTTTRTVRSGFGSVNGVAVDGAGNVFVANLYSTSITELVAYGGYASVNSLGSGLNEPSGVAVDGAGNIFVTEVGNNDVKEILAAGGYNTVLTLAGGFNTPANLVLDGSGNIYVADSGNNAVKMLVAASGYAVQTLGSGFHKPNDVAVDAAGNVFVADFDDGVVKEILAEGGYTTVNTLTPGFTEPAGVALDASGNVFVVDFQTFMVTKLDLSDAPPALNFANTNAGQTSGPQTVTIMNDGNRQLSLSAVSYPPDFPEVGGVSTDCYTGEEVAAGGSCTLSILFSPLPTSVTGLTIPLSESVSLTDNALNENDAVQKIPVTGTVTTQPAALTSPAPNSVLPGPTVQFTWSSAPGATGYNFRIGTTLGNNNLYGSGLITATSATPANLPINGEKLYVRLYTNYGAIQVYTDYVFTAATRAALTSPTPNSVLPGPTVQFTWSSAPGATGYNFRIGTTVGNNNLYGSGLITATSATPANLPTNGEKLYVRLYTNYGAVQVYTDYVFTAAITPAALTSPAPNSVLAGPSVKFTWSSAPGATGYNFRIGTTVGNNNLYGSGLITATSATPANLPINGETLYVRLYTNYGAVQVYTDYVFTAATRAALTSPTPNSVLPGPTVQFTWSSAPGATGYNFRIGTTVGNNNLYGSGLITATSATPANLPTNGETLYVRLYTNYGAVQVYTDYVFTAAP
jgi:sugar lactone lactonase YvrE